MVARTRRSPHCIWHRSSSGTTRGKGRAAAALAAWLLVPLASSPGCASPDAAASNAPVVATEATQPRAQAPVTIPEPDSRDGVLTQAQVEAEATRILYEVAAARQLDVVEPVAVKTIDRDGIREHARASMYEEITPEQLALMGRIDESLGVLPRGSDPERVMLDLLEEGVLGLYDPKKKTLFVGSFVQPMMLAMVVGHEIAHGLQDMHFDLEHHSKPMWHQSDAESARRFLIEGEAQAAYLSWAGRSAGLTELDDRTLDALGDQALSMAGEMSPYPILVRSMQMPYADGTATVVRLVLEQGWSAVDDLYENLPTTTEQMLHLDKLRAREPAKPVTLDAEKLAHATGMTSIWHDTLGEAAFLAMLAQIEPTAVARAAAAGWGGDHYVALAPEGNDDAIPTVVSATVWDTPADATAFEQSFRRYLRGVVGEDNGFIERRGDTVVFATGVHAPTRAVLQRAAWKAIARRPGSTRSTP